MPIPRMKLVKAPSSRSRKMLPPAMNSRSFEIVPDIPVTASPPTISPTAARMATSLLVASGLKDLVAPNKNKYEQMALEFATNNDKYFEIKSKLNSALENSDVFNSASFTKELEC